MPNFMNGSKNGKVLKVYNSICNHIYNIICELNNSNKSDILYYSFVTLLQKMRSLHYPTKLELAESTCIFIKNKKFSDCNEHIQHNLFTFMLELINKNEKNEADIKHLEDVYCATLKMLEVFIGVNIMKQHKLNKVKEIIDVAISMTSKTCHTIVYQKLFGLILDVIKLIIQLTINEECIEAVTKTFDSCIEDFNDYCKSFGYSTNLQKTCNTISVLIYNWVEYFLTSKPSWTFLEQKEIQKMLFKFVSGVGKVVGKIPIKCCLCSNCEVKTDLKTSVTITCLIGNLWKLSVAQTEEISISLCLMVLHYLENCCTNIKTLKNLNCPSWKNLWNEVGTTVYNIGVKLYTRKTRECLKFFTLAVHTQSSLEGIGENSIFKFNIVNSCLMCLTETYLQFNEYNAALTFAALLVSTNNSENVHRHWIRCKQSAVRESTDAEILVYTELTVVECLQQNAEKIRTVYPDFSCNFKNSDIIKLLIDELENYKIFWQSKVPMKCAFLKLYEVADLITSIKALIKYWGFNAFLLQEDIFLLLPKMLGKLERESSLEKMEKQILLASLYAIQYYGETLKARNKMMDTFNNTVVIEEPTPLPHEQPKNPNDEFDLMSSYVNLKIDVHGKIWDILSNSLSIFEECLSETVLPSTVEMIKEYDVYKIVLNIIYEFKIHCNSLKVISACFLGLRISKVLENNIFTLEIASLLLEEKTVSSTMSKDILAECNSIEKELCNSDDATDAILTQYHISKSLMYLREENVKLGYEEYQIACKYFDKLPTEKKYQVIKLKMEFLHVKYLQLPCKFNIEGHDSHSLEKFSQIYNDTTINYKELGKIYFKLSFNRFIPTLYFIS